MLYSQAIQREYERIKKLNGPFIVVKRKGSTMILVGAHTWPDNIKSPIGECLVGYYIDVGAITKDTKACVVHGSGNTVCAVKRAFDRLGWSMRVIAVVYKETDPAIVSRLESMGIEVVKETLRSDGFLERENLARAIAGERGVFLFDQHGQRKIFEIPERTTGRVINEHFDDIIDVFVGGIGTGASVIGIARAVRKRNPNCRLVVVEGPDNTLGLHHAVYLVRNEPFEVQEQTILKKLGDYEMAGVKTSLRSYPRRNNPRNWFEVSMDVPGDVEGIPGLVASPYPSPLIRRNFHAFDDVVIVTGDNYRQGMKDLEELGIIACESAGANYRAVCDQVDMAAAEGRTITALTYVTGRRF